jgi:DNA repair protein RecO (recombination protein O)
MPAEETSPAVVLRARDYAESDRIVTLLTRDYGKIGGIAKGAKASRHRFERKLEPFSHVMVHFRRRPHGELVFITRAEAADLLQFRIEEDLGRIALGTYMLELTDMLTVESGDAADAYDSLVSALGVLSERSAEAAIRQAFELRALRWAGFGLEFARCRVCANQADTEAVYFVVGRGGVVCARCRSGVPEPSIGLRMESAAALARLGTMALDEVSGATPAGADGALAIARFLNSILDRKLRTAEFLDSILNGGR